MDLNKIKLRAYVDYRVGNVIKIKGKFGFRVTVIFDDMEEKESQHSGFAKKEEAEKERNHVIAQLHDKKYVVYKNIKVEELLTYWLENIIRSKEGVSACTYNTYKNCIEKHIIPELGKLTLVKLNQGHISKLYKKLVEKYSSIPRIAKPILNTSLEFALSKNLITYNPAEGLNLPKGAKKVPYHEIVIDESKTYALEQVKHLIKVAKDTRIYLYILFALLMGLRKSEISGIKYTDIDYENRTLKIERQLGRSLEVDENEIAPKTRTKQEIDVKTPASNRVEKIPNFLFSEILEERKKYEKNRSRRQHGRWVFQDMDYICCSSYGRPRSTTYIYTHYKKLIEEAGLPYIRFHDLRHTYTTLLMKNDINQKAIAASLGHSKSIITFDVYTDKKALIEGGVEEIDAFIDEVHPYDSEDIQILKEKYGKKVLHRLA